MISKRKNYGTFVLALGSLGLLAYASIYYHYDVGSEPYERTVVAFFAASFALWIYTVDCVFSHKRGLK
ncbi:hypothetical protein AAVH_21278, partial [Aphelenchoides avenae]